MSRQIPQDHNYVTDCPVPIKAKITQLENAAIDFALRGAAHPEDYDSIVEYAQVCRYELEQTINTIIDKRVKAALKEAQNT